jgi:hypothetical protein
MFKQIKLVIGVALTATLVACATTNVETVLKNERGETKYCYLPSDRGPAGVVAVGEYTRCVNEAGTAGFRKIN